MNHFRNLITSVTLTAACSTFVSAMESPTGTLQKIKEQGYITLAYRDTSVPFSYIVAAGSAPVGYSHDIQLKVVEKLKSKLQLPNLEAKYNLVTSQTRIPLIQNGTVDLECSSTTINNERKEQVDFSVAIFEVSTRLAVKASSPINDFADLKGKNVAVAAGSTSERIIKSMNAERQLGMNIITGKDLGESFQLLETGRVAAYMMDDAILAAEIAKARKPQDWRITGTPQSTERYGCMVRKGDADFKNLVDLTIKELFSTGEINSIYTRWFETAIPPKNVNLNLPMSESLRNMITHPSDLPAPAKQL